jgi:hypothetical protein
MPGRPVRPACARLAPRGLRAAATRFCAYAILVALACGQALAASPNAGTSSRSARQDAIRSLPLDALDPALRAKVSSTVSGTSLYRRLPVAVTECDPDMYLFLVRHPEVVVNIWEVMGISNVALERTGPDTFRASDNMGTLCDVKYCYGDSETHLIYAEGSYSGPMFNRPLQARCVLLLKTGYVQETDGRYFVTSRMDTFIQIENAGVEFLAKTLQMLIHHSADYNFTETAAFFTTVSRTAEANPAGMQRLSAKLTSVEPDVRQQFADISLSIGERAQGRQAIQTSAALPVRKASRRGSSAR